MVLVGVVILKGAAEHIILLCSINFWGVAGRRIVKLNFDANFLYVQKYMQIYFHELHINPIFLIVIYRHSITLSKSTRYLMFKNIKMHFAEDMKGIIGSKRGESKTRRICSINSIFSLAYSKRDLIDRKVKTNRDT